MLEMHMCTRYLIEFDCIWQNMIFFEVTYFLVEIKSFLAFKFQAKFRFEVCCGYLLLWHVSI